MGKQSNRLSNWATAPVLIELPESKVPTQQLTFSSSQWALSNPSLAHLHFIFGYFGYRPRKIFNIYQFLRTFQCLLNLPSLAIKIKSFSDSTQSCSPWAWNASFPRCCAQDRSAPPSPGSWPPDAPPCSPRTVCGPPWFAGSNKLRLRMV